MLIGLILEAATEAKRLTRDELQQIIDHVAQAGFDPNAREQAGGRLTGINCKVAFYVQEISCLQPRRIICGM